MRISTLPALELGAPLRDKASRIKEATIDQCVIHIDTMRNIVSVRLAQTREQLSILSSSALSLKAPVNPGHVAAIGTAVLDRSVAIIDKLLPQPTCLMDENLEDDDESDAGTGGTGSWVPRVPRVLSSEVLQMFTVRLSRTVDLRVTVICMQDTCASVLRKLHPRNMGQLLQRVRRYEVLECLVDSGKNVLPVVSALGPRAIRLAHGSCARLLGRFAADLVFGSSEAKPTASVEEDAGELPANEAAVPLEECLGANLLNEMESEEQILIEEPRSVRQLRIVVKNSFIEVVEEPYKLRRTRSYSPYQTRFTRSDPELLVHDAAVPDWFCSDLPSHGLCSSMPAPDETSHAETKCTADSHKAFSCISTSSNVAEVAETVAVIEEDSRTTVMLRNVPPGYSRAMLLRLLDAQGFAGKYNFVYLPVDFSNGGTILGHALVSLISSADAHCLLARFHGLRDWGVPCCGLAEACEAVWSEPRQHLKEHIERYRNSPVMHPSMPDNYKPLLFADGQPIPFPAPTKAIRLPRIRHVKAPA
eukprot:gnl/TRDRNA2_/TRDRNA2_93643_c0_seq1.p1 gnl/TRDRNA2_/TRDRNA2_93643_c0~~gnl/TRDRNA2_/TRDRNA2_93643_c0_seq1.p1  ORF type:complete len:532 (+),score=76.35 gnl/TRDRNA2_/TRDRNA2_93643_c0_seq1:62-1657(+)